MPKRKLLLVVGAGASVEFEMPSVAGVRTIINSEAQQRYPLADRPRTNLFAYIEGLVKRYWNKNVPTHLRREPNFEDILYTIFALAAAFPAGADTSALAALIKAKKLPDYNFYGGGRKIVDQHALHQLGSASVDAMLSVFREQCKATERSKTAEFAHLKSLIMMLQAEFDIAVVSLNYDNIIYRALPGIEIGFDPSNGRFEQNRIFDRTHWPCMLHLHGSVHFDMRIGRSGDMHEIYWQPDINASFSQNSAGRSTTSTLEGAEFPTSTIVAGYGKTTQILRRPFRTYYSELDRLVAGCDAVLFMGYGFGDTHLNMAFERFRVSPRRPVAIIGFAKDDAMTVGGADLGEYNPGLTTVLHTFQTDYRLMRSLGRSAPDTVENLKAAKEFEVCSDSNTPLSFWYNGLLAACASPDKVIAGRVPPSGVGAVGK